MLDNNYEKVELDFVIVLNYINQNLYNLNFNNKHIPQDQILCSLKLQQQDTQSELELASNLELIKELMKMNNIVHEYDVGLN